ncbi:MAG: MMPL family transporter [Algoriphagus sp.]|nr:MMPL family transporter [Algoriphagus sp.]
MWSKRRSLLLLFFSILFSLSFLVFPPKPAFDYDFEQFFPQDDEGLDFYKEYANKFGSDNDYLLLAFENRDQGPWDSDFLIRLQKLQEAITSLDKIDTVISVLTIKKPRISPFGIQFQPLVSFNEKKVEKSISDFSLGEKFISKDGKGLLLLVKHQKNISKEEGDILYGKIQKEISDSNLILRAVAGKIQTQRDFVVLMQREFGFFLGISILVMIGLLILIFRTWWGVVVSFLVLGTGIVWAFGIILWLGKPLSLMSVMQPTIFLIVGLGALVHFFTHLVKALRTGVSSDQAILKTFSQLAPPVGLTMLTTAFGFLSLWFTSVPALKDFGLTTGIGIFVMFLAVMLITPGILLLIKVQGSERRVKPKINLKLHSVFLELLRNKKAVIGVFLGLSLLSGFLGYQVRVNGYLLDNLPIDHPIRSNFEYFDQQFGGSNPLEIALWTANSDESIFDFEVFKEIQKVEEELFHYFGEVQLLTPLTVVKTLNQAQNQGNPAAFQFPSRGQYLRIKRLMDRSGDQFLSEVYDSETQMARISGRLPDLGSHKMGEIRNSFKEFVEKEINTDLLRVQWTGTAYLIDRGHESVTRQMARGLGVAFVLVGIIAGILFRSWRISLILLLPNIIPLGLMLLVMYIFGIDLKLTTAILFTVAFGIAVDDSIHFMARLKTELNAGKNFLYALKRTFLETGKALILTTLILVCGFSLFMFSDFGVTFYSGILIACALIFALLADLFLLPLLLLPMKKVWEEKASKKSLIR